MEIDNKKLFETSENVEELQEQIRYTQATYAGAALIVMFGAGMVFLFATLFNELTGWGMYEAIMDGEELNDWDTTQATTFAGAKYFQYVTVPIFVIAWLIVLRFKHALN